MTILNRVNVWKETRSICNVTERKQRFQSGLDRIPTLFTVYPLLTVPNNQTNASR